MDAVHSSPYVSFFTHILHSLCLFVLLLLFSPSTPIHDVLCNNYQQVYLEDQATLRDDLAAQRRTERGGKVGKFAASQHTRASLGHMKVQAPPPREPFKLAKFRNVQPRINVASIAYSKDGALPTVTGATLDPADLGYTDTSVPQEQYEQ